MSLTGWIVPARSGRYRVSCFVPHAGVLLLDGCLSSSTYEWGRWGDWLVAEVELERGRHYLLQVAGWNIYRERQKVSCKLEQRIDGKFEEVDLELGLDPGQVGQAARREK